MSTKKTILILLALSLSLLLVSIFGAYAMTINSSVGTIANARGWLFSQSTPFGIYYGFGDNETTYPPVSDIYYFDFLTKTNIVVKSQSTQPDIGLPDVKEPTIWGDTIYSAIVGDKIFITDVYYDYPQHAGKSLLELSDSNGIYAIDTKTNTFYLYDRTSFNFFENNLASPMTAVGSYLYFFSEAKRKVWRYDTITKQSTALSALPFDIGFGGIVYPVGSKIYITTFKEYSSNNDGINNSLYVYDTLTDKFTYLNTSSLIPSNNYRSNSVINGKLYFVGGEDPLKINYTVLDKIVEYNPATNSFNITGNLGYGLGGASTTSVGGSLYVVGGEKVSSPGELTDNIIKIEIIEINPVSEIAKSCPVNGSYKNHGRYISCVSKKAEEFFNSGLITEQQKDEIVSNAAKSAVGKRK